MTQEQNPLWEQFSQFQYLLRKRYARRRHGGPTGDATRGQGRILAFLKLKDGVRTRDLAYLLDLRVSSLNELLAKLERNGYITREPDPEDKRVMLVRLTEKGRSEEQNAPSPDGVFACLTEEERTRFSGCLAKLIAALESELGEAAPDFEELRRRRHAFFSEGGCHGGHGPGGGHGGASCHGGQGGHGCHGGNESNGHRSRNGHNCHGGHSGGHRCRSGRSGGHGRP